MSNDWYAKRYAAVMSKPNPTEADVGDILVRPVLEKVLGFSPVEIDSQPSDSSGSGPIRRPDYVCRQANDITVSVIVEVKRPSISLLNRAHGASWLTSPLGQLQNYLNRFRGSRDGTWGILTNGTQWLVIRREGDHVSPYVRFDLENEIKTLEELESTLDAVRNSHRLSKHVPTKSSASKDWLQAILSCGSPKEFLNQIYPPPPPPHFALHKQSDSSDCRIAVRQICEPDANQENFPQNVFLAAMQLDFPDGQLTPSDITDVISDQTGLAAEIVIGVAWTDQGEEKTRSCRGFVMQEGQLRTTALVDTELPGSRAEKQFKVLSNFLQELSVDRVIEALECVPLHKKFHEEIGQWFAQTSQGDSDLHHLIRVMFCWILQVREILPDHALWDQSRRPTNSMDVHHHIQWLFREVLAKPKENRVNPSGDRRDWYETLVKKVPFLNGSLFSEVTTGHEPTELSNEMYLGQDGLLSILGRYDWTLSDRTGYESQTALDPSMLGEMFEQMILIIEGARLEGENRKMPDGTYYTPQDVVDEMVADSIAGWLDPRIPDINWRLLRDLIHPVPETRNWKEWSRSNRESIRNLIKNLTVLDPCCGSGAFTLGIIHALYRAQSRIADPYGANMVEDLEDIIARQIYAVDIHPLAVMITRLRLFIALVDARLRGGQSEEDVKPLPNLETRIISANTLCIKISRQTVIEGDKWDQGIDELRTAHELWTLAHFPEEKKVALEAEKEARAKLRDMAQGWHTADKPTWLERDFLSVSASSGEFDIRKLFPAPKNGWDIVIGNPPYQTPDEADKDRGKYLGYTHNPSNLYQMFVEASLDVAAKDGCITLVVPHSIVFGRNKVFQKIRQHIESVSQKISIRTYDNRPQPLFPDLPWLKGEKNANDNRQRSTIITIQKNRNANALIVSRGLIRIKSQERNQIIRNVSQGQVQPKHPIQWTQAPTRPLMDLLISMSSNMPKSTRLFSGKTRNITFKPTAMYFITCLPEGILYDHHRTSYPLDDNEFFWPWVGLYNSHLFHAYWLMIGDAFHLNWREYGTVQPPQGWKIPEIRNELERLTKLLIEPETLKSCESIHVGKGKKEFPNINFHMEGSRGPKIIRELDKVLLAAYKLPENPLLDQMYIIRTESAHKIAHD